MKTIFTNTLKIIAISLMLAASTQSAQASLSAHTYVARGGVDSAVCSSNAPCGTFAGALAKTSTGGVITVLDTGEYGSVNITQSVTIDGTGAQATIVTSSTAAITVAANTADTVILRHLSLTSIFGAGDGVLVSSGNLVMDDCRMSGYTNSGLEMTNSGSVVVDNTVITGCFWGVHNTSSTGSLSLRNVTLQGNHTGLQADGGPTDISHSLITQSTLVGLTSLQNGSTLSVSDCVISSNLTGVASGNNAVIRLTGNDLFNNTTGIETYNSASNVAGPGIVSTAGNNHKAGSTTPGAPTPGKVIVTQ